jgi:type I restriction enzyme S subunit
MNSDAKKLKEVVNLFATSESARKKKLKEKVFLKGELAEIRNHFSKDWYIADLIDVTHLITCGVAKRPEYIESGTPFLSAQNTRPFKANLNKIKFISREAFERLTVGGKPEKGDVLYTRVGNCGEAAKIQFDFDFAIYVSLTLIKPYRNLLNTDYFVAFLNSQFGLLQAAQGAIGIGLKNLNVDNVRRYIIPLPTLDEQKVIADKLDTLLAQVETTKARLDRIPQILKTFRQSVLTAAVSGKLTEEWRRTQSADETGKSSLIQILQARESGWNLKGKYKAPENVAKFYLPTLPKCWALSSLDMVTNGNKPICYGILMPKKNLNNGVLYVKVRDIKNNQIQLSGLQRTSPEIADKYARSALSQGDILVSIRGTYGKVVVVPKELDGGNITQDSARVSTCDFVERDYILYTLRAPIIQKYFHEVARGVAVRGVNISDLKPTPIPLPPKGEQAEIVRSVEQLFAHADKIEQQVQAAQQRVDKLTQSILAKAFRGELTAQWRKDNPELITGDNSAEALLAKIKAEREAKSPKKKAKTKKAKA